MKTTKVYVNDSLVVLYGEWPVEPHFIEADAQSYKDYEQALKKAIAEAVPFEDQDGVKRLLLKALNWNPHPDEHRFEPNTFYDIQAEVEVDPNKKLAVIKPLSNDWNKKESYQEGTDRSVKRVKDILESKPLSSGEKEEQETDKLIKLEKLVEKMKAVLKGYEQWEADILSEDKLWWPHRAKDVFRGKIYDEMLELQQKRNDVLKETKQN